jgi:GNAT superfamily N-acetyltransferase
MTNAEKNGYSFADLSLAKRLERAEAHASAKFVEARAKASPQSGACWIEVAGAYAMYDGAASPVTQTFGLGLFQTITSAELDQIESFFRGRGAPVFHEVSPLAGQPLAALLSERGYGPAEFTSVMYRPIRLGTEQASPGNKRIRVRAIGQEEGALWAETTAQGWSDFPELTEYLKQMGPMVVRREDSISFLAELDGKPIASATLCLHDGVALLAGACTIPDARRQGAQRTLLEGRLRLAAEQSCDIAMMCAAPGSASQRNAERQGFRIAYTRLKWRLGSA